MTTRHTRLLHIAAPVLVLLMWVAAGAIGGPKFGQLSQVANNDQASYLPSSADSTKVQNLQGTFFAGKRVPALVVIESPASIGPVQLQQLGYLRQQLAAVPGVTTDLSSVTGPLLSQDHKAAEYVVELTNTSDIKTVIPALREIVGRGTPHGMNGYVTGPAGIAADLFDAFKGIDGILLYVALVAVFVILLLVYRSVVLPFLVLLTAILALSAAGFFVYHGVGNGWFKLNSESQGIMSILAIGAATDYSLLLIARYREALGHYAGKQEALWHSLRSSIEPVTASAATVIVGVLCLIFSDLNSNKSLGPIASLGIVFAYLAAITFLPAMLFLLGRWAFWPFRPRYVPGSGELAQLETGIEDRRGIWRAVPAFIAHHARATWLVCLVLLAAAALAVPQFKASGIAQTDAILGKSNAVEGQKALERHFPAGSGSPAIIIAAAARSAAVLDAVQHTPGVNTAQLYALPVPNGAKRPPVLKPVIVDGRVLVNATLNVPADSLQAQDTVKALRARVSAADTNALVGGPSAVSLDANTASEADLHKIIPIVLVVILVILMLLLRAIVAPVVLIGSVILSFAATVGISALMFNHIFRFAGSEPAIPLFGFIFLVALGVDYNIFLMTRVREEALKLGTAAGILRGLSVTGGVITSAGIVLAATFAALAVVPILFLVQIAFIVALGVLLDTIVVRSLFVPALCYDLGRLIWWPSKLWRKLRIKVELPR